MMTTPTLRRSQVLFFGLLTAVLATGYGAMFTLLDDYRERYGISEGRLGVIVGIGFLSSFLAQILVAPLADRGHARRSVGIGMAIAVVGLLGMAFGESFASLTLARFVMGIGIGTVVPAVRRIVVNGDPANLGANLGFLLSADVAGFATGPVISALLVGSFGIAAPYLVIAGAAVACAPVVARLPIEEGGTHPANTDPAGTDGAITGEPGPRLALDLLANRAVAATAAMAAGVFLMIGTFDALWAVVLDDLDASEWEANIGITIFALPLIFLGSTGGRLAQQFGPFRLGVLGLCIGALFMGAYGFLPSGRSMVVVGTFHAIFDGLSVASAGVATGLVVAKERQAAAQGLIGAVETLTAAIVAVVAGVLYETAGREVAYLACTGGMFALAATSWVLSGRARATIRSTPPERVRVT